MPTTKKRRYPRYRAPQLKGLCCMPGCRNKAGESDVCPACQESIRLDIEQLQAARDQEERARVPRVTVMRASFATIGIRKPVSE